MTSANPALDGGVESTAGITVVWSVADTAGATRSATGMSPTGTSGVVDAAAVSVDAPAEVSAVSSATMGSGRVGGAGVYPGMPLAVVNRGTAVGPVDGPEAEPGVG